MRSSLKEFGPIVGFVAFAVLLAVNALVTRRMLDTETELGLWVIHTEEVETALGQTQSLLSDAENSERGYLLTGDAKFLTSYQSVTAQIDGRIDALAVQTADNPVQRRNIAELRPLLREKLGDMAQAVSLSGRGNTAAAKAAVRSGHGTPAMDPVRGIFAQMSAEEQRLGGLRAPAYQRSKRITAISIWLSSFVAVLGVGVLAWLVLSGRAARERYERQLRKREESYRVTLTSIGDAVIATDAQGKVDFLNSAAERLTGRKLSEAGGKDIKEVFPIFNEKTGTRVEDPVGKVIEHGLVKGLANHSALKGVDGSMTPIADSAAPIRDDRGELVGVVLVFRDVTENRRIERESRLLAWIVKSSEDAILSKDLNGIVTSWNQSAQRMFGYTEEEMVGQPVLKLYPPGREGEMSEILGRIKRGEQVEHYRTVRRTKDGTLLDVSLSVSPLRDEDGEIVGASKIVRDITAEVEAQKEVLVQRERLRVTLESIGDGVVSTDALGRVSFLNPVAEHLTGWSSREASGHPLTEIFRIVNEKTRLAAENPVYRVLREGKVVGLANHTLLIARDGRETSIADSAAPIRDDPGEVTGVVLVFRDVTEERRVEREGRLLASIVESSDDAIFSKDLDGIVTSWNQSAQRMFGYTAEEMVGQTVLKLYPSGRESETHQIIGRIKSGGRVEHYRTVRCRKDEGNLLDVSLSVSPLFDEDGEIVGASEIVRDISTEVKAQKEVAAQRERLRVTLHSIGDAVVSTDAEGRISYLNPVAEQLTGWGSAEAAGHPLTEIFRIVNEKTRNTVENPVERVLHEGRVVGLANHTVLIARDGREIAIADSAAPIRDDSGELVGVVLVFRDATVERKQEEVLRKTDKLSTAARLAATMAHEINNPLAGVVNLIFITKNMAGMPPHATEFLIQAEQELERVTHITRQSLGFYRETAAMEPVDVPGLVESVLKFYARKLGEKNIKVDRAFEVCPPVNAVAGELRQAVSNLIANAIDAIGEGETINVRVHPIAENGNAYAEVVVADEGPGIAPEHIGHLFEPFFTTKKDIGTGLGLWTTKNIVERHGGTIALKSSGDGDKARGAAFSIRLPGAARVEEGE